MRTRGVSGSEYGLGVGLVGAAALAALLAGGGTISDLLNQSADAVAQVGVGTGEEETAVADGARITGVAADRAVYAPGDPISVTIVVVGASHENAYSGTAYLFDAATGERIGRLDAADNEGGDFFRCSAAILGGISLVGSCGDRSYRGSAYLFE